MAHHHQNEKVNDKSIYYLAGILGGLFIGLILESGLIWMPILGIVGALFAGFFISVFVRGHGDF